ncbi:MAG: hypothetical protein IJH04_10595 [Eggerthellaceae bacterium]|nr:hypothetical protein [Eggerthellaceae bacterium]
MVLTCQRCGDEFTRKPTPGVVPKYCPSCASDLTKESRKAYKDALRVTNRCVDCGKKKSTEHVRCEECMKKQRAYMKEWEIGERRNTRNAD